MKKLLLHSKLLTTAFLLLTLFFANASFAQITYTWTGATNTAWNNTANWTKTSGTSFPGTVATDIVIIPATVNKPTLSTALATNIASLTFTGATTNAAVLTITGQTLTVTGAVTLNNINNANSACTITGTGTLSCASVAVGLTTVPTTGAARTSILTSSISNFTISGTLALNSNRSGGGGTNSLSPTFTQSGGTVNVGNITTTVTTYAQTDPVTCSYIMSGTTPTLNITGTTPFTLDATPTNTFTLNSTGATVNYTNAGAQNIGVSGNAGTLTYVNLGVSGGNTKTLVAGTAVSGNLNIVSGTTLNASTFAITGATLTTTGTGTLQTQNTSATPLPTGRTWSGTVDYNATAGGQTVMAGFYNNLTVSNTSNTQSTSGNVTVNGTLTTTAGGTLNMGTNQLLGTLATVANAGIIRTQNTGTAIPASKTWSGSGTIQYDGAGQNVSAGTYNNNLVLTGSGTKAIVTGTTLNGNLSISGATANVGAGLNISVGSLTLGGFNKTNGTWGATTSSPAATNQDNTYFNTAGTGIITVTTDTRPTALFSGLTASQTICFGTSTITLSGVVSNGSIYGTNGTNVVVTINGSSQNATIAGGSGAFTVNFNTASIPGSSSPYTINYAYAGDSNLQAAANNTSTALTVNLTSAVGAVSANQTICSGSSPSSNITIASATGTIQWQRANDAGFTTGLTNIGTNSTTLTIAQVGALTATRYFRAVVTSGVCSAINSGTVTVTVDPTSAVGAVSANQTICSGSSPSSNITIASATGTIQWQRANDSGFTTGLTNIGTNSTTLTIAQVGALTATRYFRAVVTSGVCSAINSGTVTVTVDPTSAVGAVSANQTICSGSSPSSNITIASATGTIQWQRANDAGFTTGLTNIGTNSTTLTIAQVGALTATRYFRAVVTSGVCSAINSGTVTVTVDTPATANAGVDQIVCSSNPNVTLAGVVGGSASSGSWSGGTGTFSPNNTTLTATYIPSPAEIAAGGNITLTLTTDDPTGPCGAVSDTMVITINLAPVTTGVSICPAGSGSLTASTVCALESPVNTAATNAGTGANVTGVGTTAWSNPGDITVVGTPYATVVTPTSGTSNYLQATNYGFNIPANATINGIQLIINRSSTQALGFGNRDNQVKLVKNNVIQATNKNINTVYPTTLTTQSYGGTADLWGTTWTPSDINDANFGAVLSVTNTYFLGTRTATVDYMQIIVTYQVPGSIQWYTASSGGSSIGTGSPFNPVGVAGSGLADTNTPSTTIYYAACPNLAGCRQPTNFVINPNPTPGSVSGGTTICSGSTSALLTLSGYTGSIIRWESSVSPFSSWSTIANTSATYTSGALTQTTQFRAVVQTGICELPSTTTTVTVDPTSAVGAASANQTICYGSNLNSDITIASATGTIQWESADDAGFTTGLTNVGTNSTILTIAEVGALTSNKYFRAVVTSGVCSSIPSATVIVTVDPTSAVGAVSPDQTICSGSNLNTDITIASATGTIQWQKADDAGFTTGLTNVGTNSTTLTIAEVGALTATKYFRAVVTSGVCSSVPSATVIVTVNTPSVAPTSISGTTTICNGDSTTLTAVGGTLGTGANYQWGTGAIVGTSPLLGETNVTLLVTPSSATTYWVRIENTTGPCTANTGGVSQLVVISTTTAWSATAVNTNWTDVANWTCGIPFSLSDVTINAGTNQPTIASNVAINSLTIVSGAIVTVTSGFDLLVTDVVANAGTLNIQNAANLLQVNNVSNTGAGTTNVFRNSSALKRLDYTLWCSPVSGGQTLYNFSPLTNSTRYYEYVTLADAYAGIASSNTFDLAKGYLIRMPNNWPTWAQVWNGQFTGTPNNGDITRTLSTAANGYNAVGNPYPSALDVAAFIDGNSTNIAGTLWFWRKTNDDLNPVSYSTITKTGYVLNNGAVYPDTSVISTGQGFIVKAATTTLNYTNIMRSGSNVNEFFKTAEKNRYWLELKDNAGVNFGQNLVAYDSGTTLGYDNGYDGLFIGDTKTTLLTMAGDKEVVIQARPEFDVQDSLPLQFKTDVAGTYTINLSQVEGVFGSGQNIYLIDNITNTTQNLSVSSYTFTTEVGNFTNRFVLVYQNSLGVNNSIFNENNVVVYKKGQDLIINSGNVIMDNVKVFDIRGRLLYNKKRINASEIKFNTGLTNQVFLVKITSDTNQVVTKKVVN